jgi:hypothetical protein
VVSHSYDSHVTNLTPGSNKPYAWARLDKDPDFLRKLAERTKDTKLLRMLDEVGLYKLNPVDPHSLKPPGFNP